MYNMQLSICDLSRAIYIYIYVCGDEVFFLKNFKHLGPSRAQVKVPSVIKHGCGKNNTCVFKGNIIEVKGVTFQQTMFDV